MAGHKVTIGAFAIIKDKDNKVLLSYRNDLKKWNLPGGRLEKGESPWEAVVREAKEETGLDVKVMRLVSIYAKPDAEDISFDFECEIIDGELRLTDEADKHEYFFPNQLPSNTLLRHRVGIEDWSAKNSNVTLKTKLKRMFKDINNKLKEY